jgi:hypothetical protein
MGSRYLAIGSVLAMLVAAPADASEQQSSPPERPRRFSVNVAVGTHLNEGGDLQAVSFGYSPTRHFALLVNVERNHIPTEVRYYGNGFAATRGGTLTTVTGEFRLTPGPGTRLAPFVFAGGGAGRSRPNVNDMFPDRVTNRAVVVYGGGGVLFPLRAGLAATVDAKVAMMAERDSVGLLVPLRAGLSWRF